METILDTNFADLTMPFFFSSWNKFSLQSKNKMNMELAMWKSRLKLIEKEIKSRDKPNVMFENIFTADFAPGQEDKPIRKKVPRKLLTTLEREKAQNINTIYETNYKLDRTLSGVTLYVQMRVLRVAKGYMFVAIVPFPQEHITRMQTASFAKLQMRLLGDFPVRQVSFDSFDVFSQGNEFATEEEKKAGKGLGKRLLCLSMQTLLERRFVRKNATIELWAKGKGCREFGALNLSEEQLEKIRKRYNPSQEMLDRAYTTVLPAFQGFADSKFRMYACDVTYAEKLVEYYKKFGFKETFVLDPLSGTYMQGNPKGILEFCQNR